MPPRRARRPSVRLVFPRIYRSAVLDVNYPAHVRESEREERE